MEFSLFFSFGFGISSPSTNLELRRGVISFVNRERWAGVMHICLFRRISFSFALFYTFSSLHHHVSVVVCGADETARLDGDWDDLDFPAVKR